MIIQQILFYFFAAFAILSGLMVVASKNPVQAVLYLVLTFFNAAALWMLLESEFLAIVLVLVYVGAVMVLFLFVVMMLDMEVPQLKNYVKHWPIGLAISALLLVMMVMVVDKQFGLNLVFAPPQAGPEYSDVKALGNLLYTNYLLPFEIAGVILLVAMIAAIGLTHRGPRNTKVQKPGLQMQVRKQDRLTILQMKSEKGEGA